MDAWDKLNHDHVFLIAEIGSNHNGDFDTAVRLMDLAAEVGAQAVKFQSFLADHLVTPDNPDHELLKSIEVPQSWYPRLKKESADRGLIFFSTATNEVTLKWMEEVDVAMYKLASPNLSHLPLIRTVGALKKPVIMSTGMASIGEIDEAVTTFKSSGNDKLALMHCVSEYPSPPEHANLRFIPTLAQLYPDSPVGFSDHTLGVGATIAAVALGAKIVEKHITMSRDQAGPDHHYALEPNEFRIMAQEIRVAERAMGNPIKQLTAPELEKKFLYYRSLHAACNLSAGTPITTEMVAIVRPNDGLHPRHLENLIGLCPTRDIQAGASLDWQDFK